MKNENSSEITASDMEKLGFNPLSLDNQLCFSLYVCSKEIIRLYTPILEPLGITYTMYIVLMALWEKDNVSVKELGKRVFLDSGTLTPLLKKMEAMDLLTRERVKTDERALTINLTQKGKDFRAQCLQVPAQMACNNLLTMEQAQTLLPILHSLMGHMGE